MLCACIAWILLALYALVDVGYYIRIAFVIGFGRLFQKKVKPLDVTSIYGVCTTQDADVFLRHMNDARYLRELDFARFHFYDRSGLLEEVLRRKGNALQGATTVRYRRSIPLLNVYRIDTRVVFWDEKNIYFEQQFVTHHDGFVRAIILSRQTVVGLDVLAMMHDLTGCSPPDMPNDLRLWLNSLEVTSARLRPKPIESKED